MRSTRWTSVFSCWEKTFPFGLSMATARGSRSIDRSSCKRTGLTRSFRCRLFRMPATMSSLISPSYSITPWTEFLSTLMIRLVKQNDCDICNFLFSRDSSLSASSELLLFKNEIKTLFFFEYLFLLLIVEFFLHVFI